MFVKGNESQTNQEMQQGYLQVISMFLSVKLTDQVFGFVSLQIKLALQVLIASGGKKLSKKIYWKITWGGILSCFWLPTSANNCIF